MIKGRDAPHGDRKRERGEARVEEREKGVVEQKGKVKPEEEGETL